MDWAAAVTAVLDLPETRAALELQEIPERHLPLLDIILQEEAGAPEALLETEALAAVVVVTGIQVFIFMAGRPRLEMAIRAPAETQAERREVALAAAAVLETQTLPQVQRAVTRAAVMQLQVQMCFALVAAAGTAAFEGLLAAGLVAAEEETLEIREAQEIRVVPLPTQLTTLSPCQGVRATLLQ